MLWLWALLQVYPFSCSLLLLTCTNQQLQGHAEATGAMQQRPRKHPASLLSLAFML